MARKPPEPWPVRARKLKERAAKLRAQAAELEAKAERLKVTCKHKHVDGTSAIQDGFFCSFCQLCNWTDS